MRMFSDENPNVRLWGYLNRFMYKQIGRKMDEVFSEFSKLGWKTTDEMFYYWSGFTESWCQEYYADKEGYMRFFPYSPYREDMWYRNLLDDENYYDDWDDFDDEEEEAFLLAALDPGDYACVERSMMYSINAMDADPETTVKIKYRVWRHLERIID